VENGQAFPSSLPFFNQRRCAPHGWKPSPGLRPPSPASGGGKVQSNDESLTYQQRNARSFSAAVEYQRRFAPHGTNWIATSLRSSQ
jgi:hypothetical protein